MISDVDRQLMQIWDAIHELRTFAKEASARPAGWQGTQPARQRAEALFAHDEKWNAIKARYPEFVIHPRACEAFERHVQTLGEEPEMVTLKKAAAKMGTEHYWPRQKFEAMFKVNAQKAQAYLYFLKISGLGSYTWRKGLKIN